MNGEVVISLKSQYLRSSAYNLMLSNCPKMWYEKTMW